MAKSKEHIDAALLSRAFTEDPYPTYHMLQQEAPVFWSDDWGSWIITRYDDVMSILKDTHSFSSSGRFAAMLSRLPGKTREEVLKRYPLTSGLFQSDPPLYTRHRRIFGQALSRRISEMPAVIEGIVDEAVEVGARAGSMDVVADLAGPMPAEVIFRALGVPLEDRDRFQEWSSVIVSFFSSGVADESIVDVFYATVDQAQDWLRRQIDERQRNPRADMLSELATARATEDVMTEQELLVTLIQFLVAGHETTTNLIANGTLAILRHPDAADRLRHDPTLAAIAIEEMLRYESPLQRLARLAVEDIAMHDRVIEAGDLVMLMIGGANRDLAQFDDPDTFDVQRTPNKHLAFGHGHHFCMGASLARLEASIAFGRLLPRLSDTTAKWDVDWRANVTFRGFESLRVTIR